MRRLTYVIQAFSAVLALLAFICAVWATYQHRGMVLVLWNCGLMILNAVIFAWQGWVREQLGPDPTDVDDEPIH